MKKLLSALIAALVLFTGAYGFAFSDTAGHWAESEIDAMTELGYLNGYPDGSFRPDDSITRAENTDYDVRLDPKRKRLYVLARRRAAGLVRPVLGGGAFAAHIFGWKSLPRPAAREI